MADPNTPQENVSNPTLPLVGQHWPQLAQKVQQRRLPQQPWGNLARAVLARRGEMGKRFASIQARAQAGIAQSPTASTRPDTAEALIAAAEAPASDLPPEVDQGSHFLLDARIKQFLSGLLTLRIPTVKVYTNAAADTVTRQQGADALTYGQNILFRSGKYQPSQPKGMALLGHELTHAAQARLATHPSARPIPTAAIQAEEQQALSNEANVLRHLTTPSVAPTRSAPPAVIQLEDQQTISNEATVLRHLTAPPIVPMAPSGPPRSWPGGRVGDFNQSLRDPGNGGRQAVQPSSPSSVQSVTPRAALSTRDLDLPEQTSTSGQPAAMSLSARQLEQIKAEVYQDLMDRIRIEFERGG